MTTKIEAIKADITKVNNVEAIVNAANSSLKGVDGAAGAIHKAAGPELLKECKKLGGCSTGDAKITGAYQLPYKAIIHTVGPMWKDGKNGETILLENCYIHALEIAEKSGIRSLAFPSISTGACRYPLKEAAEIAVKTVTKYCEEHPDAFDYICWALLVEPTRQVYETEILCNPMKNRETMVIGPDGDALRAQYKLLISDRQLLSQITGAEVSDTPLPVSEFDDIVDIEFEENVPNADRIDYLIAAASGLLSGALSIIWSKALDLEAAHTWGTEKLNSVVVDVSKTQGFKNEDLKGAIAFLEKKFPIPGDAVTAEMGGGLQHHLRDFTHHPTIIGLIFSIIAQFSGKGYGTDTNGVFQVIPLPEQAIIGKNFEEKILFGTINWAFHLISDMNGSSFNPGKGTGIPGPVLSLIKEISVLPPFKNIHLNYKESEISFSQWISKLFNGTYFRNENGESIQFDLRTEIGLGAQLVDQAKPVVINECIVRMAYFFRRLTAELRDKEVQSFSDLAKLETKYFLPYKSRSLTRMLTVSSGVFVLVNTSGTAIKAAVKNGGNEAVITKEFFLSLNYVGIVRFGIACVADAKYIAEDVREAYGKYHQKQNEKRRQRNAQIFTDYCFLSFDERKMRILYSLEDHIVQYDIENTKSRKQIENKQLWRNLWEQSIGKGLSAEPEKIFIRDEELLYSYLFYELTDSDNHSWMTLMGIELSQFEAYTALGTEQDKNFKGLKCSKDYIDNVFCKKQSYILEKDIAALSKSVSRYESALSGKTQKAMIGIASTAVVTAATGGLALAFAPEIAILFAGETVAGLYGAALTSASLAFVGGGALAAGGFGVAGGTAILAGGGAIIGIASSGTASLLNVFASAPEEYILSECAKLLTMCRSMLSDPNNHWEENTAKIKASIVHAAADAEGDIKLAEMQTRDKDKAAIRKMRTGYKYMVKCGKELGKLLEK